MLEAILLLSLERVVVSGKSIAHQDTDVITFAKDLFCPSVASSRKCDIYTIKDIAIGENSEQVGTTIFCFAVYPEHAEGSVLSRLVDETHCRARFPIVETERQRGSDSVVEVRPISRRGQPSTSAAGACSYTIPKLLGIKTFMGSPQNLPSNNQR